jgi:hypothetical protein
MEEDYEIPFIITMVESLMNKNKKVSFIRLDRNLGRITKIQVANGAVERGSSGELIKKRCPGYFVTETVEERTNDSVYPLIRCDTSTSGAFRRSDLKKVSDTEFHLIMHD